MIRILKIIISLVTLNILWAVDEPIVVSDVEVLFFNVSPRRGLLLAGLRKEHDGRITPLHGLMRPGEQPWETAERLLREEAGISTAVHVPLLVGVTTDPSRQHLFPTTTMVFGVIGRRPNDFRDPWSHHVAVDDAADDITASVAHLDAARSAIFDIMKTRPIAVQLVDRPSEPFRLEELHRIYADVAGPRHAIDLSNFRRSISRVAGLVERCDPPEGDDAHQQRARGRPPHWFVASPADRISPPLRL